MSALELKNNKPLKMPIIVAVSDNGNVTAAVTATAIAFYNFIGTPLQQVHRNSRIYFVPARLISYLDKALANPGATEAYYLPDVAVRKIQPQISQELREIYDTFGIKVENIMHNGVLCTVLVSEIHSLINGGVITAASAEANNAVPCAPPDVYAHINLNYTYLKKFYHGQLPRVVKFLGPLFGIEYLHVVNGTSDVYGYFAPGDDPAEQMKALRM